MSDSDVKPCVLNKVNVLERDTSYHGEEIIQNEIPEDEFDKNREDTSEGTANHLEIPAPQPGHMPVDDKPEDEEHVDVYVELKNIPSFSPLNSQVQEVVANSSWWDLYGYDLKDLVAGVPLFGIGLLMLREGGFIASLLAIFILGCAHGIWATKGTHMSVHGALGHSKIFNWFCYEFFSAFTGCFSTALGYDIHIKSHHPHTNIIGMGDSSTWKAPFLGPHVYLYLAPFLLPILSPFVSIQQLIEVKMYKEIVKFLIVGSAGLWFYVWLLIQFTGYSIPTALAVTMAYRSVLAAPWIHVNIFQHIGLPMYSQKMRPVRIYQMATGAANLSRNPFLDRVFGNSVTYCHVEHHLFPRLSDNMCLKIKPLVKEYLIKHGLPYQEADYMERLDTFSRRYDEYMVKAPPITHFVGVQ